MRKLPPHWWINGPSKPRVASELFRFTHIAGGHAATYRRLLRIGPWSFAVIRYRPGDDPTVPTIPTSDRPAVIGRRGTAPGDQLARPTTHHQQGDTSIGAQP